MKNIGELKAMTAFLQSKVSDYNLEETQADACRRAIWYAVILNMGLSAADKKAREAYGLRYKKITTRPYIKEIFQKNISETYFNDKEKIKNIKMFREMESWQSR